MAGTFKYILFIVVLLANTAVLAQEQPSKEKPAKKEKKKKEKRKVKRKDS